MKDLSKLKSIDSTLNELSKVRYKLYKEISEEYKLRYCIFENKKYVIVTLMSDSLKFLISPKLINEYWVDTIKVNFDEIYILDGYYNYE